MDSQISVTAALQKLSSLDTQNIKNEIDKLLPILISSLEPSKSEPAVALQSACALFRQCLPCFEDIDKAESNIFSPGLGAVRQLLDESLQGIEIELQKSEDQCNTIDIVGSLLQVCVSLLESTDCCLLFVKGQNQIKSLKVKNVLLNVGHILLSALHHCYDSQQMYGAYIEQLNDNLGVFFHITNDLLSRYIGVIRDVVLFDCSYADQLELMCDVLNIVSNFGQLSTCFGVRAMSETWKIFANLTTKYSEDMQNHLSLLEPLQHLTSEISRITQAVVEKGGEAKTVERNLKVASFLLRIVIKLCELYSGDLVDSMTVLHKLLIVLHSHSEFKLTLQGITCLHHELLDRHLVVGAEPLLSQLVCNRYFCKEILSSQQAHGDQEPVANLLLLLAVVLQIQGKPQEVRKTWLMNTKTMSSNIFSCVLSSVDMCPNALSCNVINKSSGESFGSTLYNRILHSSIRLIYTLTATERLVIEQVLFSSVTSSYNSPWLYIVISDLWVMIVRIAGPTLCLKHLKILIHILRHQKSDQMRTVYISLVKRLLNILPAKQQPPTTGIEELDCEKKLTLSEVSNAKQIINNFTYEQNNCAIQELEEILNLISASDSPSAKSLSPSLVEIWKPLDMIHYSDRKIAKKLLNILSAVSSELNNEQILITLRKVINISAADLKIETINFLSSLSKLNFPKDKYQSPVCGTIASLYSLFLQDSDILVQRLALESFANFAHCTSHEDILPRTVSVAQEVQQMVTNYLQCKPSTSDLDKLLFSRQIVVASFDCITSEEWNCVKLKTITKNVDKDSKKRINNCRSEMGCLNDKQTDSQCQNKTDTKTSSQSLEDGSGLPNNMESVHEDESSRKLNNPEHNVNYLDEQIQELITQINQNADTLLNLYNKSLVSSESLLEIEEVVKKLKQMCHSPNGKEETQ